MAAMSNIANTFSRSVKAQQPRPYYDAKAAAARRAERIAKLKRELGFGTAVVLPVSDETMKRLNNELKASSTN